MLTVLFAIQLSFVTEFWSADRTNVFRKNQFLRTVGLLSPTIPFKDLIPQEEHYEIVLREKDSEKKIRTFDSSRSSFLPIQQALSYAWIFPVDKYESFLLNLCQRFSPLLQRSPNQILEIWLEDKKSRNFDDFKIFTDEENKNLTQRFKLISC